MHIFTIFKFDVVKMLRKVKYIQSTACTLRSSLILLFWHLQLGLPSSLFRSGFPATVFIFHLCNPWYMFHAFHIHGLS